MEGDVRVRLEPALGGQADPLRPGAVVGEPSCRIPPHEPFGRLFRAEHAGVDRMDDVVEEALRLGGAVVVADEEAPAGAQHPESLGKHYLGVGEVVGRHEHSREVERLFVVREAVNTALREDEECVRLLGTMSHACDRPGGVPSSSATAAVIRPSAQPMSR